MGLTQWIRGPVLGRGSTATVSLAIDSVTGNTFAVKSSELSKSGFLQKEQRFMSFVKSPHVVSYLGFDVTAEEGRSLYNLFMEYASGGSVADEIERRGGGGLEEWRIRSYARGILMGVSYLHSVGIAHCDVKGKNVLVGSDGLVKIADLGCAKWVHGDFTGPKVVGGTPAFMAPEVVRGEEQGTEADLWAVGCTVIEMATGRSPWSEVDDLFTAVNRIGFSDELPEFPKWLSDDGRDFLDKCLRRNASQRWTAEELLRHPFVSELCPKNPTWRSPKCVLDQDLWDSMEGEEEAEQCGVVSDPIDRIRQLGSRDAGVSCSTWDDDNWTVVRGGVGEEQTSVTNVESSLSNYDRFPDDVNVVAETCDSIVEADLDVDHRERSHCYCSCFKHMTYVGDIRFMINDVNRCFYSPSSSDDDDTSNAETPLLVSNPPPWSCSHL